MRKGWCVHYSGGVATDGRCAAGLNVRELVGGRDYGWLRRIPCIEAHTCAPACAQRQFPTDAEVEADRQEWVTRAAQAVELAQTIKATGRLNGTTACPRCAGVVQFAVAARSRHVHAACTTAGCLSFTE